MQKNMIKAIGVFTLVLFVLSVTGAAACNAIKANNDNFSFTKSKNCGNVMKNDVAKNAKVISYTKCSKGTISMKSNGTFCYKAKSCSSKPYTDSFRYTIKNSCGQTSTAKVTIKYKC